MGKQLPVIKKNVLQDGDSLRPYSIEPSKACMKYGTKLLEHNYQVSLFVETRVTQT